MENVPEPTDLDVAISVAQQLLDSDQVLSLREAMRLLLRALGAEPGGELPLPEKTKSGERVGGFPEKTTLQPEPSETGEQEAARRSVDRAFPAVAAFLATERGAE